jgi:hypothetical protein
MPRPLLVVWAVATLVTKLQAWAMWGLVMARGVWVSFFKLEDPLLT